MGVCAMQGTGNTGFDAAQTGGSSLNAAGMVSRLGCFCDACPNAVAGMFRGITSAVSNFSFAETCPLFQNFSCFSTHPQCKATFSQIGSTVSGMIQMCNDKGFTTS